MNEIIDFFNSVEFNSMEDDIAQGCQISVDRDDIDFMAEMAVTDIAQSKYSFNFIRDYSLANKQQIHDFAVIMLKKDKGETFGAGFSILFSIYLCYLKEGNDPAFLAFLKQRSIPKVENFLKKLKEIYTEIAK